MIGDKETFWLGWELVGDPEYAFHRGDAGIMGDLEKDAKKDADKEGQKDEEKHQKRDDPAENPQDAAEPAPAPAPNAEGTNDQAPADTPAEPSPSPEPEEPEPPSNYTLCSPQLLHLDTDGTPLWFNGWLLDNKFANKHQKRFGSFRHYLIEPRDVREPGAWQLHENNECCLTTDADKKHAFSDRELALVERMMQRAREVGAPGS